MQDYIREHIKQIIILVTVLFLGAIVWGLVYTFVIFHITEVTPSGSKASQFQPRIIVSFNKELSANGIKVGSDNLNHKFTIDGKKLIVNIYEDMELGKTYSFTIENITSQSGDVIKNHKITFTTVDDRSLLSDEDTQIILDRQLDKEGLYNDPIYNYVPYSTLDYKIDAIDSGGDEGMPTLEITISLSAADVRIGRDQAAETYKQRAIDYLNTLDDIDASKYKIVTTIIAPSL